VVDLAHDPDNRDAAIHRYMQDRDVVELQVTMTRLDVEAARTKERGGSEVTPQKARHYLENLDELWEETEDEGVGPLLKQPLITSTRWGST